MANLIMFCIFAVVIVASSMMCVTTTRIMRAATFMLFMLLGVAGLYFLLDYTYLGATQLAVYAGGVTMIFAFAIQLVSKRSLQGTIERIKLSRVAWGGVLCIISCAVEESVYVCRNGSSRCRSTGETDWYGIGRNG